MEKVSFEPITVVNVSFLLEFAFVVCVCVSLTIFTEILSPF